MAEDINKLKAAEAAFFDGVADIRTRDGHIPIEADLRRATRYLPKNGSHLPVIDPQMTAILDGKLRKCYLDHVAYKPGGRILDLGCGSGWLALELGRRGQHVDAYDISPKAISLAKQMLAENPYRDGFGSVNYHLQDVTEVDLGEETYDAISGWSAFHHLPDFPGFMKKVQRALKPGGILATMDDMPRGRFEKLAEYALEFILPTWYKTYAEKFGLAMQLVSGKRRLSPEVFTPMEEAKHASVYDIEKLLKEEYTVLVNIRQNAFVGSPAMLLKGPDTFRYAIARTLVALDQTLCFMGIVKGFERIIIARKVK